MNVTDKHVAENKAAIDKNIKNKLIKTENRTIQSNRKIIITN